MSVTTRSVLHRQTGSNLRVEASASDGWWLLEFSEPPRSRDWRVRTHAHGSRGRVIPNMYELHVVRADSG